MKEKKVFDAAEKGELLRIDRPCEICPKEKIRDKAKYLLPTKEFACLDCAHKFLLRKEDETSIKT